MASILEMQPGHNLHRKSGGESALSRKPASYNRGVPGSKTDELSKTPGVSWLGEHIQTVQEKVVELASTSLGRGLDTPGVDEPLYGTEAGFDSFSLLEFILRLEDEFGIAIPDEDLDPDIFRSINTVVAYVLRRIGENETQ